MKLYPILAADAADRAELRADIRKQVKAAKRARRTRTVPATPRGAQRMTLLKGLTHKAAYRAASARAERDFRGFSYDPKTGRAVLT